MKKILLMWATIVAVATGASAQCVTCVPAISGCNPNGGICGHSVVGMVNHPYSTNISFYMPKRLNDPSILSQCSCNEVDLHEIKITGVGGLPTGINATFNHANADYNVQNGDSLGCANFCGTPLAAGTYPITIYIEAHVLAVGTPIGSVDPGPQNQTYVDTMIILPDTSGSVSSFNYTPHVNADCDSLTLAFNSLLTAPSPNPTSYSWNFGNGQTSAAANPAGTYTYNTPGIHPVSLQTVFYKYRIKEVKVYNITGGYYPDIEELTSIQSPDPYIKINPIGYVSANQSDTKTPDYPNLNLVIPIGTSSLSMELWDADNGPPFGSADDLIGTYTINIINGLDTVYWANSNANGFVVLDTVFGTSIVDTLKLNIEGRPDKPSLSVDRDSLCLGDSARILISPQYSNVKYEWWRDSTFLLAATDSVFYAKETGNYRVRVTNLATGCSSAMDTPYLKINVATATTPTSANIIYSSGNNTLFLNPLLPGNVADWYFNGVLITGQNGQVIPSLGPGVYKAFVYAAGFRQCSFTSADYTLTNVGIVENTNDVYELSVYPNPNNGSFAIKANIMSQGEVSVKITDMLGREVYQKKIVNQYGQIDANVDISDLAKDVYTVQVSTPMGSATRRVVVK